VIRRQYSELRRVQLVKHWERTGQAKIAVQCKSEEELLLLQATAQSLSLVARSIQDAFVTLSLDPLAVSTNNTSFSGRTQIAAGSTTVLGIGPGWPPSFAVSTTR
jgi:PTH2 family peptidyl-tRNA hydrolase